MCGRYTISAGPQIIADRFGVDVPGGYKSRFNAAPSQLLPVITAEQPEGLSFFYWGLIPSWSKNKSISTKLINARAETLAEKASFRTALKNRRCIVPADGFYEWKRVSKKGRVPNWFFLADRSLFSFAGLWEEFENEEGEMMHTFTIITTEANDMLAEVHDRMPVILNKKEEKIWLNPQEEIENATSILNPYPAGKMGNHPVSSEVNQVTKDSPLMIRPAPAADQFGNYTLFD